MHKYDYESLICDCDVFPDCKSEKYCYAKAFILPQKYEHLYSLDEAIKKGTIFKDLYKPYYKDEKC